MKDIQFSYAKAVSAEAVNAYKEQVATSNPNWKIFRQQPTCFAANAK